MVLGARSAVFAPLPALGLIVVDEEHESSFKQQNTPRYHARDVGLVRAKRCDAVVLLGSATPALETYKNALDGRYGLLRLTARVPGRRLPEVRICLTTASTVSVDFAVNTGALITDSTLASTRLCTKPLYGSPSATAAESAWA